MTHSQDDGHGDADVPDSRPEQAGYLKFLRERFPHVADVSLRLLLQHATFCELCEEHEACAEVLQRLSQSPADEAIRSEYSALSLRLEGELLRYIAEHGDRPGRRDE